MTFIPRGQINNIPTLVQVMAWRRPGDKPLSEPMTVRLPTHICVTRHQWVKDTWLTLVHTFRNEVELTKLSCHWENNAKGVKIRFHPFLTMPILTQLRICIKCEALRYLHGIFSLFHLWGIIWYHILLFGRLTSLSGQCQRISWKQWKFLKCYILVRWKPFELNIWHLVIKQWLYR